MLIIIIKAHSYGYIIGIKHASAMEVMLTVEYIQQNG